MRLGADPGFSGSFAKRFSGSFAYLFSRGFEKRFSGSFAKGVAGGFEKRFSGDKTEGGGFSHRSWVSAAREIRSPAVSTAGLFSAARSGRSQLRWLKPTGHRLFLAPVFWGTVAEATAFRLGARIWLHCG